MYFQAKMDQLAKLLSVILCCVLIIPLYDISHRAIERHDQELFIGPSIIILAVALSVLYQPKGFTLDAEGLHIKRLINTRTIALANILSAEPMETGSQGFSIRTFGTGGFLGYFGTYWYKDIGHTTLYVTDRDKMLLIRMPDHKTIVISPDDQIGFLAALKKLKG